MLSKKNRLRSNYDYKRVRRFGKTYTGPLFNLTVLKTASPAPRFGIVASKRLDKRATVRNRVRRLLGEALRSYLDELSFSADVVIVVKKAALEGNFAKIREALKTLLEKAGLLKVSKN